jgi:hypothetical protein
MLFNSYPFVFLSLPITLAGFFALGRRSRGLAIAWLALIRQIWPTSWPRCTDRSRGSERRCRAAFHAG